MKGTRRVRDEQGRRIPRPDTKSAQIYALKLAGKRNVEIARELGMKTGTVGVLWQACVIRNSRTSGRTTGSKWIGKEPLSLNKLWSCVERWPKDRS
jgi:hypothetical protein